MPVTDFKYPLFALARYIDCDYRTKTVNSFVRYSQTMSHKGVQVGYIKTFNRSFLSSPCFTYIICNYSELSEFYKNNVMNDCIQERYFYKIHLARSHNEETRSVFESGSE